MRKTANNRGFTLIEMSVVLVVVGLIIGSVLVGGSILQNARTTSTANAMDAVRSAASTYNQNYSAWPGDDTKAASRFSASGVTATGGGNGSIGIASSFTNTEVGSGGNGAGESALAWQCLRSAGLVKGAGSDATPMGNSFGGVIGLQNGAFSTGGIPAGTNVVCASQIPGLAAMNIDTRFDDGLAKTGKVRGGTDIGQAPADYADGASYVVCMEI